MSVVYPLETSRYAIASILAAYGAMTFQAVVEKAKHEHSMGEVRAALIGLRRAGLANQSDADLRWSLSESGTRHWRAQHPAEPTTEQPRPRRSSNRNGNEPPPIDHPTELLTRGMVRLSSPADRLPMVYRPGALDSANLPRICGSQRVWPDGRREPLATAPNKDAA